MARPKDDFKVSLGSLLKAKLADVPPDIAVKLAEDPQPQKKDEEEGPKLVIHARKKSRGKKTRIRVDAK